MRAIAITLILFSSSLFASNLPKPFSALDCEPPAECCKEEAAAPSRTPCPASRPCPPNGVDECVVTPYLELDGEFFDFRRGGGGLFFTPAWQCADKLLFVQGHAGYYRDYLYSGSLGLGFREELFPRVGLGLNAFLDAGRSDRQVTYLQGGVGAELFGPWWLGRINGYVPTLKSKFLNLQPLVFGNQIALGGVQEKSYGGIDMEAGVACPTVHGELWGFAGMYIFDACHVKPIVGPRLRLEWRVYDFLCCAGTHLTIGGQYTYDHLHRSQGQLVIRIRMPFGAGRRKVCCDKPSHFCRRMGDPVQRQTNIWVERQIARARTSEGGQPLATIWFASATGGGKGTQDKPASIDQVNAWSSEGDIIFLLPYDGPLHGPTLELKANQRLLSFGSHDEIGIPLPFQDAVILRRQRGLKGIHSTFIPYGDMVGINAGRDVDIQGIRVDGGSVGIVADQGGAISIHDVVLSNQSSAAMIAKDGDVFEMSNSHILSSPQGVRVSNYLVSDIHDNRFSQISGNALWFEGSRRSSAIRVHRNSFAATVNSLHSSGSAPAYLAFENNRTIASGGLSYTSHGDHTPFLLVDHNTFEEIPHGLTAANIQGSRVHLSITNNTIQESQAAHAGFLLSCASDRAIIRDNVISDLGGNAIDIRNELTDPSQQIKLLVERNTILRTGRSAFHYLDSRLAAGRAHLTLQHSQMIQTAGPTIHIETLDGAEDRIGLAIEKNLIGGDTALLINVADGPIIDLWPSNQPAAIRNDHNMLEGKIILDGHVGQLAAPPSIP